MAGSMVRYPVSLKAIDKWNMVLSTIHFRDSEKGS